MSAIAPTDIRVARNLNAVTIAMTRQIENDRVIGTKARVLEKTSESRNDRLVICLAWLAGIQA